MRRVGVKRAATAALALAALGSLPACGGDDRIVRTGPDPARVKANGMLDADPAPLTLAEVAKLPRRSPQEAVLRLYFWGQWGSAPNAVGAYDRSIVRAYGAPAIVHAFAYQRSGLLASRPRIAGVTRTGLGSVVTVDLFSRVAPPQHDSFLLRRHGDRWAIVYDTLLQRSMAGRAADAVLAGEPAPSPELRRRADRSAAQTSQRYREFALGSADGETRRLLRRLGA
jgi:hypothetical protein